MMWHELVDLKTGKQSITLDQRNAAVFAAHLPHRVEAQQDSAFLLVMGGQA